MKNKFLVVILIMMSACAKTDSASSGKTPDAATQVGVSTSGVIGQTLNAPGNYMRNLAGAVDKAKKAADLMNEKASQNNAMDEQYKDGGK